MSVASHGTLRLPPLGKQSMARLIAEAKRSGVSPEDYAKRLVEDGLHLRREAEEKSFGEILEPVGKGAGKVTDAEIVGLVEKFRAKRRGGGRWHRGKTIN
jgi:hypothetical protein